MFAAIHLEGGAGGASVAARVRRALEPDAVASRELGALCAAWTPGTAALEQDGRLALFSGHLLNARPLAATLERRPDAQASELVLAAWRQWGDEFAAHLRGAFALLVWDAGAGRGIAARDHLGGGGLFRHVAGGQTVVADELGSVVAALERTPAPSRLAVVRWVAGVGTGTGETFYEGVRAVPGAHLFELGGANTAERPYWRPAFDPPQARSREEAAVALREAVQAAVARQLPADERAGVLLSGGLDSSTVAAAAVSSCPGSPPHAYSAVFPDHPGSDESALIDGLVSGLHVPSTQIEVLGGSPFASALEHIARWRAPLITLNAFFWRPLLERVAEDGTSVLLDGEGGDELFGFLPNLVADRIRAGRVLAAARLVRRAPGANVTSWRRMARGLWRLGVRPAVPHRAHKAARRLRRQQSYGPMWLTEASSRLYAASDDATAWKQLDGPLWWRELAYELTTGRDEAPVRDHLRRTGVSSGVDRRHPLLHDVDLATTVLGLPPEHNFDPRFDRSLIRDSMAGLVPDAVRLRPGKTFFNSVLRASFVDSDWPVVRDLLADPKAEIYDYVSRRAVREEVLDQQGQELWMLVAWRLATTEVWLRSQGDPTAPAQIAERLSPNPPRFRIRATSAAIT